VNLPNNCISNLKGNTSERQNNAEKDGSII